MKCHFVKREMFWGNVQLANFGIGGKNLLQGLPEELCLGFLFMFTSHEIFLFMFQCKTTPLEEGVELHPSLPMGNLGRQWSQGIPLLPRGAGWWEEPCRVFALALRQVRDDGG